MNFQIRLLLRNSYLLLFIFSSCLFAQDITINASSSKENFIIRADGSLQSLKEARQQARGEADKIHRYNYKYYAGEYLIYDCKKRYFACVNKESYDYCKLTRKKSKMMNHSVLYCAHLKKFKTLTECLQNQYKMIHKLPNKLFCINIVKATTTATAAYTEIIKD